MLWRISTLTAVALAFAACVTPAAQLDSLQTRASFDLDCDDLKLTPLEEKTPLVLSSEYLAGTSVGVRGCGKRATYVLIDDGVTSTWVMDSSSDG